MPDLGDHQYIVNRCVRCKFIWQGQVLDNDGMEYLYEIGVNAESSLEKRERSTAAEAMSLAQSAGQIESFFAGIFPRQIRVMDYGAGWGHWAQIAKAIGFAVIGYEISKVRLSFLKTLGIETLSDTSELASESFQVIRA